MTTYGQTFKNLREAKGISLSNAAKNVVSKSFLSRFEREQSNIVFDKLYRLLLNINVSVEEFVYLDNQRHGRYQPFHYEDTKDYVDSQTVDYSASLSNYYYQKWQTSDEEFYYVNFLKEKVSMEKHQLAVVEEKEKTFLFNYLFNRETWTHYEVRLYMSIISLFTPMQSFYLTQQMVKNGSETIDVNWNHQADFLYVILNTALIMAYTNNVSELIRLIAQAKSAIHNEQYLYEKTELHFIEGLLFYLQGKHELAKTRVKEAINVFNVLDSKQLAKLYSHRWEKFFKMYNNSCVKRKN
ncbi:transcriptional regulator [Liquorilactobacillus sucicola DSM 21376 = JCM 15457]|uniref:DNA-binding helix-turn-helix protein n=1 Tax=Liquorilactobacillus sucicola DSM 21376 = JCM 15457 TaxID=1423806 RepID=A0A023CUT8_9LACO|nr:Rgg/GadR/MutR family transcriptional regulator [Liquorilactobacillus sucicola]KRN05551.1 DNA-binding helix-turn-helix protein [Liquorilactobacillus sucicola DSM 21376 = JCM 15457]GAJ25632.1 transcriptional regulator [Liquorilactobacillus sucicola DSM 21376 = JCM 15457]